MIGRLKLKLNVAAPRICARAVVLHYSVCVLGAKTAQCSSYSHCLRAPSRRLLQPGLRALREDEREAALRGKAFVDGASLGKLHGDVMFCGECAWSTLLELRCQGEGCCLTAPPTRMYVQVVT
jgi:hypothetical protein